MESLPLTPDHAPCPCNSGACFAHCCRPYLEGARPAPTAQALMRSRYSAYALNRTAYLLETWHPATRPAALDLSGDMQWRALDVLWTEQGGADDAEGVVAFAAHYTAGGQAEQLREISRFRREHARWYYVDGDIAPPAISRNAPCPCGSGKKFKRCCAPSSGTA